MGTVVTKFAAIADQISDTRSTLENATLRGGLVAELAAEKLHAPLTALGTVEVRWDAAAKAAGPFATILEIENEAADTVLARASDRIWDALGRRGRGLDPYLSILFPDGSATYSEVTVDEQPDAMDALADLLRGGVHPKLAVDIAEEAASEVEAASRKLRAALDQAQPARARLRQLEKVRTALARACRQQLMNLKRAYQSEGMSEAEIHRIIPDRSQPAKKAAPAA